MKGLRGTAFNPFGYTAERRMERGLIRQYEARHGPNGCPRRDEVDADALVALAELPLQIRGFGPVKEANAATGRRAARRES